MKSRALGWTLSCVLIVIGLAFTHIRATADTQPAIGNAPEFSAGEKAVIDLFERVAPSVVQIAGRSGQEVYQEAGGGGASGTGFIWDAQGHIVTNAHVVEGARQLVVRLASGEVAQARLIGAAPQYDLAVLRISVSHPASVITLGSSLDLKVGQSAYAIGNPFGLDQSLTTGIVSALKRRLPTTGGREIGNVIQTDAAVNPGNSGGPLLDSLGRLIGVTTAILSPSGSNAGIGFAIPVDTVKRVVPELIAKGRVPTPGIGVALANEAIATRLGVTGAVIVTVAPGSPAERAGLRGVDAYARALGDVILQANGKPVRRLADLTDTIEEIGVGREVSLKVLRGNQTRDIKVNIADLGE